MEFKSYTLEQSVSASSYEGQDKAELRFRIKRFFDSEVAVSAFGSCVFMIAERKCSALLKTVLTDLMKYGFLLSTFWGYFYRSMRY